MKKIIGVIAIYFLCLISIILWLLAAPFISRFNGFVVTMMSIGQLAGLLGTVLFAVNLIVATRIKFIENYFTGLNGVYLNHHSIGGLSLILLLIHPLALSIMYIPTSVHLAAIFFLPTLSNLPQTYGIIALILMIVFLFITFYLKLKYHIWKFTHKFLGLAFLIGSLHVYFIPSDISRYMPLRFYMLSLVILGLASVIYKTVLGGNKGLPYIVKNVNIPNEVMIEIELEPINKSLNFKAGQFAFVSFNDAKIGKESHPFSVTSSTGEKIVSFSIKVVGDYTDRLKNIRKGTEAYIEGPFGVFNFRFFPKNQIWISGGVGITPFLSMARDIKEEDNDYNIRLYYCVNKKEEAIYLEELDNISKKYKNIKIESFFSNDRGMLNANIIENDCKDIEDESFLLCGPPPMMTSLKNQLRTKGVSMKSIYSEEFNF